MPSLTECTSTNFAIYDSATSSTNDDVARWVFYNNRYERINIARVFTWPSMVVGLERPVVYDDWWDIWTEGLF